MLVNGTEVLEWAQKNKCAAGSFNTYNLEGMKAIVAAAEEVKVPIFLSLGVGALEYAGFNQLTSLAHSFAAEASVPIALHIDHCEELNLMSRCVEGGFSSFMIDGSHLSLEENIVVTKKAKLIAGDWCIEAELGGVAGSEDESGDQTTDIPMTNPQEAERFVSETGIHSLAIAIGNAHGIYKGIPKLDFDRLSNIQELLNVPLVLHGASGIPDADILRAISLGIRKININTVIRGEFFSAINENMTKAQPKLNLVGLMRPAIAKMKVKAMELMQHFKAE